MSKFITEDDTAVGYSSEQDDFESEQSQEEINLAAEPCEIYVGNTGQISPREFYNHFKKHGSIIDMSIWRTHNHLYHARIVYRKPTGATKAIKEENGTFYNEKRIRVSMVNNKIILDFKSAIRIDDIAECTEEEIHDHFSSCGEIRFVINTGFAAYVQFKTVSSATSALGLEKILNGDPYTLSRIAKDDRVDHMQLIQNMKDIKYRKPFVMVENYPRLDKETALNRYKASFESVGPVRHFKIAPTLGGTVTLALCMEKTDDRELVIDKFNGTMAGNNQLKIYIAPGKARMTIHHAATYALGKNSVVVTGIPPYYKDYDVCMMFRKCGEINFLERFDEKWLICFESQSSVSLTHYFHYMINRQRLVVHNLTQAFLLGKTHVQLQDNVNQLLKNVINKKYTWTTDRADEFLQKTFRSMDSQIKKGKTVLNPFAESIAKQEPTLETKTKSKTLSEQAQLISSLFKENAGTIKAAPVPAPKRPASNQPQELTFSSTTGRVPKDSQVTANPLTADDDSKDFSLKNAIYIGNLVKGIEEDDLRVLFRGKEIRSITMFCNKDSYHPTASAYVAFVQKSDAAEAVKHNHDRYRGKRVVITHARSYEYFYAEKSLMIKNLTKNIDEEALLEEVEKVMGPDTVVDVLKPAHHYAYVDFKEAIQTTKALNRLRTAFTRYKIDVFPLYRSIPKRWVPKTPHHLKSIEDARKTTGLKTPHQIQNSDDNFGVHNAHKLFVGNIPRDSLAEDIVDYFNNFGNVIDYKPIEKKSCYLRKSVILSFANSKHAQNVYVQLNHYFEGSLLELHLMDTPPLQFEPDTTILTVKFHSPFLTCDEIRYAMRKHMTTVYSLRFDAYDDCANLILRYNHLKGKEDSFASLADTQYINDEAIVFADGLDLTPPRADEARESKKITASYHRKQKEAYLSYVVYKENLKDDLEVRSRPNTENDVPFKVFYNDNSVQINNVSMDTTLEDIRDLFYKCGNVTDFQALILEEDRSKICYVKFDFDLAADLACMYNQRLVNDKRILVHLAKETLHVERDRSILVERLNPQTTTEQIYDSFSRIGMIKYVQKQSPYTAVVCFKDQDSMIDAVNVTEIQNSGAFIINPCYEDYDARFFNNFTATEEFISIEKIRTTLKPRLRPEYHQLEIERQVFDTLALDVKASLINEVFLARRNIPNFNTLPKSDQIHALKTYNKDFSQKEHFLRLTVIEQEKLLVVTGNLQDDYPYEETRNLEIVPPPVKQPRNDPPVNTQPDKKFAANWYCPPQSSDPGPGATSSNQNQPEPQQNIRMNANHVAQALPSFGLLNYGGLGPGNNAPMSCPPPNIFPPMGIRPTNFNVYPMQGQPPVGIPYGNNIMRPMRTMVPMRMPLARDTSSVHWERQMYPMNVNAGPPGQMNYQPPFFR